MENLLSNRERAEVLTQALPYIKKYSGKIVVIKYGGNAMINEQLKQQVMEDITLLWLIGVKVVLVHGGGPEISETMKRLGKQAQFVNGLRVTDKETVDIVQMVLAGKVNKTLVNLLQMKGGHAVGVSGIRMGAYGGVDVVIGSGQGIRPPGSFQRTARIHQQSDSLTGQACQQRLPILVKSPVVHVGMGIKEHRFLLLVK